MDTNERKYRRVAAEARKLLSEAGESLTTALQDKFLLEETPLEIQTAMEMASEAVSAALEKLTTIDPVSPSSSTPIAGGPTPRQGQFLAFIREYTMRNEWGLAPTHAEFQRYFQLTPPSVNSMLIRLEKLKFIRRVPNQARAIQLTINPDWIPPLNQPFRL